MHGASEDVEKQPATKFRLLQDNADKFQRNKDLTDRRIKAVEDGGFPSTDERGEEASAAGVDSTAVRRNEGRETLLKLALPAAGRPAAVTQLDDFLNGFSGSFLCPGTLELAFFWGKNV